MTDPNLIVPVILSGGAGTRLWPMSRDERPKQFLALASEATMFAETVARVSDPARFAAPVIVANTRHADLIESQLGETEATLLLEPLARNTGPAIALAALAVAPTDPLLVMPSDHVIGDRDAFMAAIAAALPLIDRGWLVTFGIAPDAPETGYGYIRVGEEIGPGAHRVERFVEKPDAETAVSMLAQGGYVWNGGIFLFRADAYLRALADHAPAMLDAARAAMASASRENGRIVPDAEAFAASPSDSIDYAVMEKAERVAVVPVSMGWSDIGSWDALYDLGANDDGHAHQGDVVALDTTGCLLRSDGLRITTVGVENLIVVASGTDILILPRGRSQEVKRLLAAIKERAG
ncbi:MAG: mannose-1-phosphate guanylyltransferase/mannose-6-phosphate isomerase [Sphingomonadaceae bacterium]